MVEDLNVIWSKVLRELAEEVSSIAYESWMKPIRPVSMTESVITLEVPFDINKNMIMTKYFSLLESCLESATSRHFDIEVQVEESKEQEKETDDPITTENTLNPKYTFENFVVGKNNNLAYAAALSVAEAPSQRNNPLFLYGGSGLGKTHMMQAIGNYVKQNHPNKKVLYVSSEKFTYELINAIKDGKNEEFRKKYRTVDLLLLDDVQFIAGKQSTQEEFFHTFNTLYDAGKNIVLTSDRLPKEISHLEERIESRFSMGLIADVQPPDYETRMAILRSKLQVESLNVSEDIVEYVADNITSNVRDLEGAVKRILAYAGIRRTSNISIEVAQQALRDILSTMPKKQVDIPLIIEEVERYYHLSPGALASKKRSSEVVYPRQIAMYIAREILDESYPKIGAAFGGRHYTTVMHAVEKIQEGLASDQSMDHEIKELIANIKKN